MIYDILIIFNDMIITVILMQSPLRVYMFALYKTSKIILQRTEMDHDKIQ
jgi:hypothetical protein